jgi:TIGR03009 family protein
MRCHVIVLGFVSACFSGLWIPPCLGQAQKASPPAYSKAANNGNTKEMDDLLADWEKRSAQIKTLRATFTRSDKEAVAGVTRNFRGEAELKAPDLAYLDFREYVKPNELNAIHERIVCTGQEVLQYVAETKQIFVFPLAKQEKQRIMEEGPLPFLFNMKVQEAKRRYRMQLLKAQNPNQYLIHIIPLQEMDKKGFKEALVLLNKETFLPDAIKMTGPNGKDTQTFKFLGIHVNQPVDESKFKAVAFRGWKVVVNPGPDGAAGGGAQAAGGPPAAGAAQPAMKPARRTAR